MARVAIQEALLEDNKAFRDEIAAAHAVLDRAGRVEPTKHLSERIKHRIDMLTIQCAESRGDMRRLREMIQMYIEQGHTLEWLREHLELHDSITGHVKEELDEREIAALIGEVARLRAASVSALTALRARRDVEEHMMEALQYSSCPACCNQRPCAEFQRLETTAQSAAAQAVAALRGVLAKGV